jgi:hypothetical protein
MLDAALEYARRGDPVFPVWHAENDRCGCRAYVCESPAKHPVASCAPNGLKDATTDQALLSRWWDAFPRANLAMRTGITAVVLDIDPARGGEMTLAQLEAEHGPLPATPKVLTGGGGWHLYFAPVPGLRNSAGRIGPGVDVRAEDGYVLVPPSNHVSGGCYRQDRTAPATETARAPMPAWLAARAKSGANGNDTVAHRTPDDWGAMLAGAPEGQRREVALKIAGHYLGQRIAEAEVVSILLGYAVRCSPPFPEHEARQLVRDLVRRDRAKPFRRQADRSAQDGVPSSRPVLCRLSDVAPRPVEWLWPRRIALGKPTVLAGDPGLGKSYLTMDITARITTGSAWPDGGRAPQGDVILLSAEDDPADTIRPRLDALRGDPSRVTLLSMVKDASDAERQFCLANDLPVLEETIKVTPGTVLVVIDPVSAYLGKTDSYKDAEVRALLAPLATLAIKYRVAVLIVMHLTKASDRRAIARIGGSIGFVGAARGGLVVDKDADDPGRRLLAVLKSNNGAEAPTLAFRLTAERDDSIAVPTWEAGPVDGVTADSLLASSAGGPDERAERIAADDLLADLLEPGTSVPSKAIYDAARANGISERTLNRAKRRMGIKALHEGQPGKSGQWRWHRPEMLADELPSKLATDPPKIAKREEVATFGEERDRTAETTDTSPKVATALPLATFGGNVREPAAHALEVVDLDA